MRGRSGFLGRVRSCGRRKRSVRRAGCARGWPDRKSRKDRLSIDGPRGESAGEDQPPVDLRQSRRNHRRVPYAILRHAEILGSLRGRQIRVLSFRGAAKVQPALRGRFQPLPDRRSAAFHRRGARLLQQNRDGRRRLIPRMTSPIQMQHINVKLLASDGASVDLEPLIPIFHGWIRDRVFEEMLLDVADYRHVHEGPGVMVIGHQANYSVDNTSGRLGVRYNRKASLRGTNQDRLKQAVRAALAAFPRLASESSMKGTLGFGGCEIELFINDRALAPNTEATRIAAQSELHAFFGKLFQGADYALTHEVEPRRLFAVRVKTQKAFSLAELLANIGA